jgi:hypothetical protein
VLVRQRDRRELFGIKMFEVKRQVAILLELACTLALGFGAAEARAASAELNAEVPAMKWKALRLRGLPQGASLAVRVETSGPLVVIFVHQSELKRFPENRVRPQFRGSVERRLSFRVSLPAAGDYYVILDNRRGDGDREVRVQIQALPARKPPPAQPGREPGQKAI